MRCSVPLLGRGGPGWRNLRFGLRLAYRPRHNPGRRCVRSHHCLECAYSREHPQGGWRALVYVDDQATQEQQDALLAVFTGRLGGAIADLASLIGEVVGVERVPITFTVEGGKGTLAIGQNVQAELVPLTGPTGEATTLHESIFSTIPGSPAYVSRAVHYRSKVPALGHDLDLQNHNAIQGTFRFAA